MPFARVLMLQDYFYRRRKGTLPMLEELARTSPMGAHAVEFFEASHLESKLNHLRMHSTGCRTCAPEAIDRLNTAFDFMAHTVDVLYPAQDEAGTTYATSVLPVAFEGLPVSTT